MGGEANRDKLRLGFLTALELPQRGYVGGLLVTNHFGRPLEFQCTTPVKANRTQELLYGPTLVPFVIGELIGKTLVEKVNAKPHLIITDRLEFLELRAHVAIPVVCLDPEGGQKTAEAVAQNLPPANSAQPLPVSHALTAAVSESSGTAASGKRVHAGRQFFRIHEAHHADGEALLQHLHALAADADLAEPIERVREALNETMASGGAK